jgi:hypothetical protein
MKSQLVDVNLAIWGTQEFKRNVVPLYVAQMVYAEVATGVEMDWSKIPTSSQPQRKPNLHHKILWSTKTRPNPLHSPFGASGSKQSLVVPIPINVSFDAHALSENCVYCNLSVATKKCPIEFNHNKKVFDRTKLQLDNLVITDIIFS